MSQVSQSNETPSGPAAPSSPSDTGEINVYTTPATGQHQAIRVVGGVTKPRRWTVVAMIVAALVAFFAVGQFRGEDDFREQLQTESEGDLTRILASLSSESTALQEELAALKIDLNNVQNSTQQEGAAAQEANDQLAALQVLAGTVPVTGAGLEMVIADPSSQVTFDALVDAVQELRDAGAEALTINGRRIGATSSFGQRGNDVTLDGVVLPRPFSLTAIGPAATMEGGLNIPGGSIDTLRARNGVQVSVNKVGNLEMPALENPPKFEQARPVGSNR